MPTAYDLRRKPQATPKEQVTTVVRRPRFLIWAVGTSLAVSMALVTATSLVGASQAILMFLCGSGLTWLAGKVR